MIMHILRLAWNRRTSNSLVLVEILASFLVVFAVLAFAVFFWQNSRKPIGYEAADLWYVYLQPNASLRDDSEQAIESRRAIERLVFRELRSMDRIEQVAVTHPPPYRGWTNTTSYEIGDRSFQSEIFWGSEEALDVMGFELIEGRWFQQGDEQLAWIPALINLELAQEMFGDGEVVGEVMDEADEDDPPDEQQETRVIGVIRDYRKAGEFSSPRNFTFRYAEEGGEERRVHFAGFKVTPGTSAQYEEEIVRRLQALAPDWSFSIASIEDQREDYRRTRLLVLLLAGTVAGFLLLMVGLGLLGVLWQTVTQRTQEIGVRRAKGAAAPNIHIQILGELLAVTAIAIALGTALLLQLPLIGWFDFLTREVTIPAFFLAVVGMFGLTVVSGLYPSWLATRVQPAEALHYE